MAATKAKSGKGTLLRLGDGATPTEGFTTVLEVKSIDGPSETAELEDVTHMESPSDYKEYIPTLLDGGELAFEANLVPGDPEQEILTAALQARARKNARVIVPGGLKRYEFAVVVTRMSRSFPTNASMKLAGTLKITGPVALVANV
jgi:hypothetical protein